MTTAPDLPASQSGKLLSLLLNEIVERLSEHGRLDQAPRAVWRDCIRKQWQQTYAGRFDTYVFASEAAAKTREQFTNELNFGSRRAWEHILGFAANADKFLAKLPDRKAVDASVLSVSNDILATLTAFIVTVRKKEPSPATLRTASLTLHEFGFGHGATVPTDRPLSEWLPILAGVYQQIQSAITRCGQVGRRAGGLEGAPDNEADAPEMGALTRTVTDDHVASAGNPRHRARLYGVPPRNRVFAGRGDELAGLRDVFVTSGCAAAVSQAAVHGLGGIGKTSVAVEFAHRYAEVYAGIWWAPAENRTVLVASLLELGSVLALRLSPGRSAEALAQEVLESFAALTTPWLVIYDNVPSPSSIRDLVPRQGAHLLMTTRWTDWTDVAVEIELPLWDSDTAARFILDRVKRKEGHQDAARLAEALGYLPLAIDHAGAYLRHTGASIRDYLKRLGELIQAAPADARYPRSVFATFNIAIERAVAETPDAGELLAALAVLAPERIPFDLIDRILPLASARDAAVAALSIVSLVKHDQFADEAPALIIHRLVQAVMFARLDRMEKLAGVKATTVQALNDIFPDDVFRKIALWPQCEKLLPHAMRALQSPPYVGVDLEQLTTLGHNATRFLHGRSELKRAKSLYLLVIKLGQTHLGCQHANVIRTLSAFVNLLLDAGRVKLAEPVARAVVRLREQAHGRRHFAVAQAINNLGIVLRDAGRLDEADRLFADAIAIAEESKGARSIELAVLMNNHGNLLLRMKRFEKAETLFANAIDIGRQVHGRKHSDVATWEHNLAILLVEQGRFGEVEPLLLTAMDVLSAELGKQHPNTLRSRVTHSKVLLATGRHEAAYTEASAAILAYKLAISHPWVVDAAHVVHRACLTCGYLDQANDVAMKYALTLPPCE